MKIGVLIKQVPATGKVKMDEETGTMIRKGLELESNPLDMYAVEEAIRTKERIYNQPIHIVHILLRRRSFEQFGRAFYCKWYS